MAWTIEFTVEARKDLRDLDRQTSQRILKFVTQRLAMLDDVHAIGDALRGPELSNYWKYRVGDYRVIADIQDRLIKIVVIRIGNRREVYRR